MNIYIDESGSINNNLGTKNDFVVAMILVKDSKKLSHVYKRFVASKLEKLKKLDREKVDPKTNRIIRQGGKMFKEDTFLELKGAQFDAKMKKDFVNYFIQQDYFDIFFLHLHNDKLSDSFCSNTSRGFNYLIKLALGYFFKEGFLTEGDYILQFDERNERTETRFFLEEYLNTELVIEDHLNSNFNVTYFDSRNNKFIQIADVFANLYYSHLLTGAYSEQIEQMKQSGRLKYVFEFPPEK